MQVDWGSLELDANGNEMILKILIIKMIMLSSSFIQLYILNSQLLNFERY